MKTLTEQEKNEAFQALLKEFKSKAQAIGADLFAVGLYRGKVMPPGFGYFVEGNTLHIMSCFANIIDNKSGNHSVIRDLILTSVRAVLDKQNSEDANC